MCVDVYCALLMHVMSESKDKEGNVCGFASFIDMKSTNVRVTVDVVGDEIRGLKYASNISQWSGL